MKRIKKMDYELLQRYIEGRVTAKEAEQVVDWLDADEAHVKEFMALHKAFDISVMNQSAAQTLQKRAKQMKLRSVGIELAKVAAVICIVFGVQYILNFKKKLVEAVTDNLCLNQTLYVPAGQRAELILPDSTKVWLNAHSKLVYPLSFHKDTRSVELSGEAYFEVRRNEKVPFVVKTSKVDIKVLGTEFNVSAYEEDADFEVALLKGKVLLESSRLQEPHSMKPGEMFFFKDGQYYSGLIQNPDYFKWKEGLICFRNEPISDIIDKLSLYFDVKIQHQSQAFLKERYTGKFRSKDGVEQVLKVLQMEHHFHYVKDNEQNVITIK